MSSTSLVEAFLLIEQPRQRLGHWTAALASLDSHLAPSPVAVAAYYDPSSDQALLNLQYDAEALGDNKLEFVVQVALLAEVGMVQPAELSEGERVRFLSTRLQRCTIRVTAQRTAIGALSELVRTIKGERGPKLSGPPPIPAAARKPKVPMPAREPVPEPKTRVPSGTLRAPAVPEPMTQVPSGALRAPAMQAAPEPATQVPSGALRSPAQRVRIPTPPELDLSPPTPTPVQFTPRGPVEDPLITAKGTRDDLARLSEGIDINMDSDLPQPPLSQRMPTVDIGRPPTSVDASPPPTYVAAIEGLAQTSRHVVVRSSRYVTAEIDPVVRERLRSHGDEAGEDDRITTPMDLDKLQALAEAEQARKQPRRLRPPTENDFADEDDVRPVTVKHPTPRQLAPLKPRAGSEPYVTVGQQLNIIYARYLRGGRWVPVRVGALSLKGAALLAGALPRIDDRVDIALTFDKHRALVRGMVAKVSTRGEAAQTGASTFSVTFVLDAVSRRQLTALLLAARNAKVTIKPPPPRATRRFPVEWQVALATVKGAVKTHALDVSTGGMFVRSPVPLEMGTIANFSVVLDDGGAPIGGRARVVRKITDAEARTCGLAPGFGLEIVDMSEADRMRWLGFLARIERRAEKRVLIGAEPARLAELQAGLASLGYAVCGGTDPGTLVQLANGDARPADAVLIDAGWLQNESSTNLVESLFSARNVPCVTMHGEVRRARQAIDRLLEVVV